MHERELDWYAKTNLWRHLQTQYLNLKASSNGMFDMMFLIQYAQHQIGEKPDKFGTWYALMPF